MKTPEEIRVLAEIEAAKERGEDPFGDNDPPAVVSEDVAEVQESIADPDQPAEEAVTEEVTEEAPAEPAAVEDEFAEVPQPTAYQANVPEDYKTQRAELVKEKAGLMKKLLEGEIDSDEFSAHEARISDSLEELTVQRIRAETLLEANAQSRAQYQSQEIQRLIAKTKVDIDYKTDVKAQKQFDAALQAISADPESATREYAEILGDAHKVVLALRGIAKPPAVEAAAKSRAPEVKPPVTLRSLPTAATPNANGNMLDQLGRLSGQAYQDAFAKLSPNQRRALLDEA